MIEWGAHIGRPSRQEGTWLVLCALLLWVVVFAMGYDQAVAQAKEQGTYCWRTGPRPGGRAMYSDNGKSWHYAD